MALSEITGRGGDWTLQSSETHVLDEIEGLLPLKQK